MEISLFDIVASLFVAFVGLSTIGVSLFRLRTKEFTLLNFGLFCFIYGLRWLVEIPVMADLMGFPFASPYFHTLLTYVIPIPTAAFLVNVFNRGLYDSLLWFFRTAVIYAVSATAYDLLFKTNLTNDYINPILVIIWCLVAVVNLIFIKGQQQVELLVLRSVFIFVFLSVANDNLVNMEILPWDIHLEHVDILVLCIGMGFVAVRRFYSNEKKLFVIEEELNIARQIQYSNLPDNNLKVAGFDIAARYVPMTSVAGDFYDIQVVGGGDGVGIIIADVSGHGVGAALIG